MSIKKITICFIFLTFTAICNAKISNGNALIEDGYVFNSISGTIQDVNEGQSWIFTFDSDFSDKKAVLKAGTSLQLLPSSTLEKIIADANSRDTDNYQLWGRITQYKGRNYIFPSEFRPIRKNAAAEPNIPEQPENQAVQQENEPNSQTENPPLTIDANDIIAIPENIRARFEADRAEAENQGQRIVDSNTAAWTNILQVAVDSILIDRNASIVKKDGEYKIFLDGLGQNTPRISFNPLPCAMLELFEQIQTTTLESVRFNVSGIVTHFKGEDYLLLSKAIRIYNYGNFGQ